MIRNHFVYAKCTDFFSFEEINLSFDGLMGLVKKMLTLYYYLLFIEIEILEILCVK